MAERELEGESRESIRTARSDLVTHQDQFASDFRLYSAADGGNSII